jgi:site-specific recombinase XerD
MSSTSLQPFELTQRLEVYLSASISESTRRAYASDCKEYLRWCELNSYTPASLTSAQLSLYIAALAESHAVATITRRLAAINELYKQYNLRSPAEGHEVRTVLRGIRRVKGVKQTGKQALLLESLERMLNLSPHTPQGLREKTILLLGFAGGFRRSELVDLQVEDVQFVREGALVTVRRSKTDQEGKGMIKAIPYGRNVELCPVTHLQQLIGFRGKGHIFTKAIKGGKLTDHPLTAQSIALIVKRYAKLAGLEAESLSAHSLRAGFATQAAMNGASDREIMNQTGHRSRAMVDRYIRTANIWAENGANKLGL